MDLAQLLVILATAITTATPLVFACLGEMLTERAGVINLSAEGTVMLGAMVGFVVAKTTESVWLGFLGAAAVGMLVALIVAYGAITLRQSQIAIGFVLALLCSDLSSYLGNPYVRIPGPTVPPAFPIPILEAIPMIGPLFFRQGDVLVYASYVLTIGMWFYFYRTRAGLTLRAIGEQPAAAFVRGHNVIALRYLYTLVGGAMIGIAGAAFSLDFKAGWSHRHTAGYGWIALAIVIFGGWNPLRAALGAICSASSNRWPAWRRAAFRTCPHRCSPWRVHLDDPRAGAHLGWLAGPAVGLSAGDATPSADAGAADCAACRAGPAF
jgi:ABC-type uncharacterized transport system permease subunit